MKKKDESPDKLKTDLPISEKDEVKEAEKRTRKAVASVRDPSVAAELKIRGGKS